MSCATHSSRRLGSGEETPIPVLSSTRAGGATKLSRCRPMAPRPRLLTGFPRDLKEVVTWHFSTWLRFKLLQ